MAGQGGREECRLDCCGCWRLLLLLLARVSRCHAATTTLALTADAHTHTPSCTHPLT